MAPVSDTPTVTVFTIAESAAYAHFIPRWWNAILLMNPRPTQIVITHHYEDHAQVITSVPTGYDIPTKFVPLSSEFGVEYFNAAVMEATSEWVAYCGIDDQMTPHALADLNRAQEIGANVAVANLLMSNGNKWTGSWNPEALKQFNTLPAHSPYKRSLWEQVGGYPDVRWSDWGFWLRAAPHVIPYHSQFITAIFDIGETHETMSGINLDDDIRQRADEEIRELIQAMQ